MISLDEINDSLSKLSQIAFYIDDKQYKVDKRSFDRAFVGINECLNHMNDPTKQKVKQLEDRLKNFEINKHDFEEYTDSKVKNKSIIEYFSLLDSLSLTIMSCCQRQYDEKYNNIDDLTDKFKVNLRHISVELDKNNKNSDMKTLDTDNIILNKHNPFSDIVIKNQSYYYPDNNGYYKQLSFKTGYKLTKMEDNDKQEITLVPDFSIEKNNIKNASQTSKIIFDDTLTTKLPEKIENHILYYLQK